MVGNEERFLTHYQPFIVRYDKYMSGHFASIGELVLPSKCPFMQLSDQF